ncbi:MAG: hypothetical protein MUF74_14260 [Cypionkella sp.]|nr:hypothetical protein [Cypionkella sp.]
MPSPGTTKARSSPNLSSSPAARSASSPGGMSIQICTSARARTSSNSRITLDALGQPAVIGEPGRAQAQAPVLGDRLGGRAGQGLSSMRQVTIPAQP